LKLTEEQLANLEELGKLQFDAPEAAVVLGLDAADLLARLRLPQSPASLRWLRGQMLAEAEIRKSIFTLARQGSTPAQKQFLELVEDRRKREKARAIRER